MSCAKDTLDGRESAVHWDTLETGVVRAVYQRLPQEPRLTVEADLRLGSVDGEGEAVFAEIRGIDVDASGRLMVLDHQVSEVRAFDADGGFLELVASFGEGTREISRANSIRVDGEGALRIHDHGRMRFTRLRPVGEIESGASLCSAPARSTTCRIWIRLRPTRHGRPRLVLDEAGAPGGIVTLPANSTVRAADGEHFWATEQDELDVESVVRYRLERQR